MMNSRRVTPSISSLQCFDAAARHLSFTRAAEEMCLTQSAISKQVAILEELLGHSLFQRIRKRLHLTPAGELYVSEVTKILNEIDKASRYIISYGGTNEVLRIATPPTFADRWLLSHIKGFEELHPDIHLDIKTELHPFDLMHGKADIGFFFGRPTWPGADCVPLFHEKMLPVCSPEYLDGRTFDCASDLSTETFIQCTSRSEAWPDWFMAHGVESKSSYRGPRFDTFFLCCRAARKGLGIAMLPEFLVTEEIENGTLVTPFNSPVLSEGCHHIAFAESAAKVPKILAFVSWIEGQVRGEVEPTRFKPTLVA